MARIAAAFNLLDGHLRNAHSLGELGLRELEMLAPGFDSGGESVGVHGGHPITVVVTGQRTKVIDDIITVVIILVIKTKDRAGHARRGDLKITGPSGQIEAGLNTIGPRDE